MSSPPFAAEVAACRAAQRAWAAVPVRERLRRVRELRHLIVERADDLCAAVEADIGRPAAEVVGTELLPTAAALKYLEQDAARVLKPRRVPGRLKPTWLFFCRDTVHRRPWGIVAVVGTWNYPVYLNAGQVAQALVAGNGVVWKPSENAPRTADATHRLFLAAGFPPDLFAKLPATREAGPLVAEADVDHVVFTGSDAVGRRLAARLGERLIPSTLELSGCDAMFVLDDANVELAARAAWFGVTLNRGQTCIAVRRVFVHQARHSEFVDQLSLIAAGVNHMPLVTAGQVERAEYFVKDAIARGARPVGVPRSPNPPGNNPVFAPTILESFTADLAVCREPSFAPIAVVTPFLLTDDLTSPSVWPGPRFKNLDDAFSSLAAGCPFGLSASVFTADTRVAEQLAARIPSGSVVVNDVIAPTAHPATPFGGRGASGWGVTQGPEGLLAMTVPQVVTVHRGTFRPHVDDTVSPDPATPDVLRGLLRATHGRGLWDRLRGLRQLIRGIRSRANPGPERGS